MQTVCHLHSFNRAAATAGMNEAEIDQLADYLSANPTAGAEIAGSGGCRKLRWARPGEGKRGGYRVITFFTGDQMPVFLVTVFAKGERSDLSQKEIAALRVITKSVAEEYKLRVRKVGEAG